jgi:hypothetical protein
MKKTIAIFVSLDLYRYDLVLPTLAIRAAADGQLAVAEREQATRKAVRRSEAVDLSMKVL